MRRRTPAQHDEHAAHDDERAPAPIVADPDAEPVALEEPAPVYPTEADEAEAVAHVLASDPHLSTYALQRAVSARLAENRDRAVKRQRAAAATLVDERATVFPTEAHVLDLHEAIPHLSDDDERAVMHAGYDAFLASIDAREPVLTVPTDEES